MTDKVQKIREEVERLHKEYRRKEGAWHYRKALRTVLFLIDSMQEEHCTETEFREIEVLKTKLSKIAQTIYHHEGPENPTVERIREIVQDCCYELIDLEKPVNYNKPNTMLDESLSKETKESWNERLDKKDFRERYKRIAQSESFKKAHEGISIGDTVPVEGEESEKCSVYKNPQDCEIYPDCGDCLGNINEEPVSKVWHDATEKCVGDKDVLFHSAFDNRWYVLKVGQLNQNIVDKWAYIEDILNL